MPTIIFRKNFEIKKDKFDIEIIKKFPYANEFYTAIRIENEELGDKIIDAIITRKKIKEEFFKLSEEEKESARDIFLSIINLTPEFASKEIIELLNKKILTDIKKLKTEREKLLGESAYLYLCKPEKYFKGISEGELIKIEEDFLIDKEKEIIK